MENFERVGPSPFQPDGTTVGTDIEFVGGSKLEVYGGSPYDNFRLKFSNGSNEGWWVGPDSLDQLIAELLYIRRDTQKFKDGIDVDIEVGREPAPNRRAVWIFEGGEGTVEVEEEEEDEAPF